MSRESNYFRSMNSMSTDRKDISTTSIFGTISSILTGGKKANIKSTSKSESRETDIAMPYGFASFGFNGMKAHILKTGAHKSVVGIIDSKRPKTKNGEVIIYTRDGTQIKLDNNGNIDIKCDKKISVECGDNYDVTCSKFIVNGEDVMDKIKTLEDRVDSLEGRVSSLESRL